MGQKERRAGFGRRQPAGEAASRTAASQGNTSAVRLGRRWGHQAWWHTFGVASTSVKLSPLLKPHLKHLSKIASDKQ